MQQIISNLIALLGMLKSSELRRVCAFDGAPGIDPMLAQTIRDQAWKVSPRMPMDAIRKAGVDQIIGALDALTDTPVATQMPSAFSLKEIDAAFSPFGLPGSLRPPVSIRINSYVSLSLGEACRIIDALRYVVSAVRWLEQDYDRTDPLDAMFLDLAEPMLAQMEGYPHDLLTITRDEIRKLRPDEHLVVFVRRDRAGNWSVLQKPGSALFGRDDELQWHLSNSPMARMISLKDGVRPYNSAWLSSRLAA